jgi:hypothetical protein
MAAKTKKERSFWGVSSGDVVKTILTFVLGTIPGGLFVYWLNNRAPHLYVAVADTVPFQGEKNRLGIVDFTVTNDGEKMAEHVECSFHLDGCSIQEVKITPDNVNASQSVHGDAHANWAVVKVSRLNAGQSFHVETVAGNPEKLPPRATVEVNGDDVRGEVQPRHAFGWSWALIVAIGLPLVLGVCAIFGFLVQKRMDTIDSTVGEMIKSLRNVFEESKELTTATNRMLNESVDQVKRTNNLLDEALPVVEKAVNIAEEQKRLAKQGNGPAT